MVMIPLGTSDWGSQVNNIARIKVRNMYIAANPSSPDGLTRISRPTLTEWTTVGNTGPIYGMWRQESAFAGDWFIVSGTQLYRIDPVTKDDTFIGDIPGTDYCQFAAIPGRLIVVRNGTAYSYDGTSFTIILFPDDVPGYEGFQPPVESVCVINNTFIFTIQESQRFYWILPGETDPDPLNFASAERNPDNIVAAAVLTDEIWFLGKEGPEVWQATGDIDDPFTRINGRVYNEGCLTKNTIVQTVFENNPCLIWVTNQSSVVMAVGSVGKISTESEEELLKNATNLRAWGFRLNRSDFYILTADEFTLVYNLARKEWYRWDSIYLDNWRAHLGGMYNLTPFSGDYINNTIWKLEEGLSDNDDPVVREISGFVAVTGKPISCKSVCFRVNAGWSNDDEIEPVLDVRWSDDQGATWSNYESVSLGTQGFYNKEVVLRSLGRIDQPGRLFEFRFTDKVRFRLDYANMNEV